MKLYFQPERPFRMEPISGASPILCSRPTLRWTMAVPHVCIWTPNNYLLICDPEAANIGPTPPMPLVDSEDMPHLSYIA